MVVFHLRPRKCQIWIYAGYMQVDRGFMQRDSILGESSFRGRPGNLTGFVWGTATLPVWHKDDKKAFRRGIDGGIDGGKAVKCGGVGDPSYHL